MKLIICLAGILILIFVEGCVDNQTTQPETIIVKIIPLSELDDAPETAYFWEKQKVLFPQIEIPNPLPKEIPYKSNWLLVSLENDGKIKVDDEKVADLSNLELLQVKLKRIFAERERIIKFMSQTAIKLINL